MTKVYEKPDLSVDTDLSSSGARRGFLTAALGAGALAAALPPSAQAHGPATAQNVANVRDLAFGAQGDGITDDTNAIRLAFASQCDVIYFPAGKYLMTQTTGNNGSDPACLMRSNKTLVLIGDGAQATQLIWNPPADNPSKHLIKWSTTTGSDENYDRLEIRGITLKPLKNLGTAIHATKQVNWVTFDHLRQTGLIQNVEVVKSGRGATEKSFAGGIYMEGMEHSRIQSFVAEGAGQSNTTGIIITSALDGSSPAGYSVWKATDVHLHHVTLVNYQVGIMVGGELEGVMITDSVIIGATTGINYQLLADGMPGVYVRGCHLHFLEQGVALGRAAQAFISDNVFYLAGAADTNVSGVHCGDYAPGYPPGVGKDVLIRGNLFIKANQASSYTFGVVVPGSGAMENVLISDNQFTRMTYGVFFISGSDNGFVSHSNRYFSCSLNVFDGSGINTIQP